MSGVVVWVSRRVGRWRVALGVVCAVRAVGVVVLEGVEARVLWGGSGRINGSGGRGGGW